MSGLLATTVPLEWPAAYRQSPSQAATELAPAPTRSRKAALVQAWAADCHHVLLQTGRTDPRVHRFYERLGFVPGRRTAYVALKT